MKTFEEWYNEDDTEWHTRRWEEKLKMAWNAAREGMIPEDEAVWIDWSKAPDWADCVRMFWGESEKIPIPMDFNTIPRPTPAWKPKPGEVVFFYNRGVRVGKIHPTLESDQHLVAILCGGVTQSAKLADVKPFNPDYIGEPWDEIVPF